MVSVRLGGDGVRAVGGSREATDFRVAAQTMPATRWPWLLKVPSHTPLTCTRIPEEIRFWAEVAFNTPYREGVTILGQLQTQSLTQAPDEKDFATDLHPTHLVLGGSGSPGVTTTGVESADKPSGVIRTSAISARWPTARVTPSTQTR